MNEIFAAGRPWVIEETLRRAIASVLASFLPELDLARLEVAVAPPPEVAFGDWSSPVCLRAAKLVGKPPLELAAAVAERLQRADLEYIAGVTVTPPGYINFWLDFGKFCPAVLGEVLEAGDAYGQVDAGRGAKVVIEHTNVNPNKAAHIGHLRNACLGDVLGRIKRRSGYRVEVQNYIDDTGAAVADVVVGMYCLGRRPAAGERFDYFCWDLYTQVAELCEEDEAFREKRREVLHLIEQGDTDVARFARDVAEKIVDYHLQTMGRLGVTYDLLTWESEIIRLGFWRYAFEKLKDRDCVVLEKEGPNAGCWVIRLGDVAGFEHLESPDKVLVRSNGTATYTAKDLAYQMWKFGVLGKDFLYRRKCVQPDGRDLWTSSSDGETLDRFGRADVVVNVIDIRQKYLQDVLRVSLLRLGYERQARNSIHFGYEVVALSPRAAAELRVPVTDEREIYAMSGRKGIGVKADDLIDAAVRKAAAEVAARNPQATHDELQEVAAKIAAGAIRYYMVRYNLNSVLVFDFEEALNMQGNTGPYLEYAYARAASILRKAAQDGLAVPESVQDVVVPGVPEPAEKALVKRIAEFPRVVCRAGETYTPSLLADYAYSLATEFMEFYEAVPVLNAVPAARQFRLLLVSVFRRAMGCVLDTLGIPALDRM